MIFLLTLLQRFDKRKIPIKGSFRSVLAYLFNRLKETRKYTLSYLIFIYENNHNDFPIHKGKLEIVALAEMLAISATGMAPWLVCWTSGELGG